jgi:CubicO group peptidase (beta-lactamase class C family)
MATSERRPDTNASEPSSGRRTERSDGSAERVPPGATIHPDFAGVAERFPRWVQRGRGGAIAVYHRGELVLDTWAGRRDVDGDSPWERGTVAMGWSTTKGVTSAAAHLLAQQGAFGLDDRVADHWPDFAASGKAATTVRHVLSQEAGLHDVRHLVTDARSLLDHDEVAAALAAAAPAYVPGTANSYHALTYGYLVDEIIRRTTGQTLPEVVQTEIAEPLGLDGFGIGSIGLAPERLAPPPPFADAGTALRGAAKAANVVTRLPPVRIDLRAIASAFVPRDGDVIGSPAFLASGNGSVGGLFTARDLARFYAALVGDGGLDGVEIWSPSTLDAATATRSSRRDRVLSVRPYWSAGFHRPWPRSLLGIESFGFFGMFGSGAWADRRRQLAVALVTPDTAGLPLAKLGKAVIRAADER